MKHLSETGAFELSKADVKALLAFAGRDAHRSHICGVHFRPREGDAVATDGTALARAKNCGQSDGAPFTVPRAALQSAARMLGRKTDVLRVACSGQAVAMNAYTGDGVAIGSATAITEPSPFPPVEQVIPLYEGAVVAAPVVNFDAELLARLLLVQKAAGCGGLRARYSDQDLGPVRFDAEANPTAWTAVVMPRRRA